MRKELDEMDLNQVAGGKIYLNGNTMRCGFSNGQVFQLQNCNQYEVLAAAEGLRGQYATEAQFDDACIALFRANGWI